jgi:hypothetical protein
MILGDLNYRLFNDNKQVRKLIKIGDFEELMRFDELKRARDHSSKLQRMVEGPLTFYPTYKYDSQSDEYDTSSKKRVPAWCDRILFSDNKHLS